MKVDDTTSVERIFDSRLSYTKAPYLLCMLQWILGDDALYKGLRSYLNDPALAYGFAKTNDLIKHLEQVSGKDLTQFFKDWYEGQGYPSYKVQWSPLANNQVEITMNQTTSHPSVSFFALPVALKFTKGNLQKTVVVDNKFNGQVFVENIGFISKM